MNTTSTNPSVSPAAAPVDPTPEVLPPVEAEATPTSAEGASLPDAVATWAAFALRVGGAALDRTAFVQRELGHALERTSAMLSTLADDVEHRHPKA
ncbi:MAG TPA: hypothetical protein PLR99_31575 [Polyangiaceae bacterium]|nr:hypothetical protein [Polyangiaceae bacterium]